jgi:endonuclease YncB( thermonuclease family)
MDRRRGSALLVIALAWILPFGIVSAPSAAGTFSGKVTGLISADTITVVRDQAVKRIHLYGIISPQKGSPHGKESFTFAEERIFGHVVEVEEVPFVGTKRTLGIVRLDGIVLNEELLRKGMVWLNPKTCRQPFCDQWKALEDEARAARRGLWANPKAAPPWDAKKKKPR